MSEQDSLWGRVPIGLCQQCPSSCSIRTSKVSICSGPKWSISRAIAAIDVKPLFWSKAGVLGDVNVRDGGG